MLGPALALGHLLRALLLVFSVAKGSRVVQDGAGTTATSHCMRRAPTGWQPPLARKVPKRLDTAAGPVFDDFFWLRDDTHTDPNVLAYLAAENTYAAAALQQLQPLAGQLANEMEGRLSNVTQPVPVRHGSWWYNERQNPGQSFWLRYRLPAKPLASTIAISSSTSSSLDAAATDSGSSAEVGSNAGSSSSGSSASRAASAAASAAKQVHGSSGPPGTPSSPSSSGWDESGPDRDVNEQVVLDPNYECAVAAGSGGSGGGEHCDVFGATVSPDGQLVAFGVDVSGSEQYQLAVRHIASSRSVLPAPIPGTSGDYEWAGSSDALFFITRNATTNRPDHAWYVELADPGRALLLWQEDNPAFYLSLSRSSSGRFLLLASASEVTRQVLLLDLAAAPGRPPSRSDWLHLAPRQPGVRQQAVAHWQSWLFVLVVSPETPNGELRVAPLNNPLQHTVLLAHREEVELEDVRLFAHHLVLAERQLGHTTITVYCLPADSSEAAAAACRYNSTAASAAEAQAAAEQLAAVAAAAAAAPHSGHSQAPALSSSSLLYDLLAAEMGAAAVAAAAAEAEQLIMLDAADDGQAVLAVDLDADSDDSSSSSAGADGSDERLLDIDDAVSFLNASEPSSDEEAAVAQQSKTFLLIRGRAGSTPAEQAPQNDPPGLRDPAAAVEQQRLQQQQQQQSPDKQGGSEAQSRRSSQPASSKDKTHKQPSSSKAGSQPSSGSRAKPDSEGAKVKGSRSAAGGGKPAGLSLPAAAASSELRHLQRQQRPLHLPLLAPANSWQVAFEEDAYSVNIIDAGDWASPSLRLSYTSFTTPQSIIDIDMATQRRVVRSVARVGAGFRSSAYRSYRLWAPAADGAAVPLSLVYRLDTFGGDGLNPALLLVYGAYGTKYDPEFDSRLLALLDRGWVVGIAHVRGGGELGYAWHAAGRLSAKANSWGDLVAAARSMVAHNLTSPSRLAVWGRSAGALTAAAAVNAEPGLFSAALLDVPFLDVLGDLLDVSLPLTVKEWEEWGNPAANATLAALIAGYSPVHNVRRGVAYPHMLVTAGLMDKRVGYWEAAKWVAQLRVAAAEPDGASADSGSAPRGSMSGAAMGLGQPGIAETGSSVGVQAASQPQPHHPQQRDRLLLLRTDMSGGHFSAGGSAGSLDDAAVKYAFLIATLPSCGSPEGLTGPDLPDEQLLGQPGSLLAGWPAVAEHLTAEQVLALLARLPVPPVLRQLLVALAGGAVLIGLVGLVWSVSKVWWPAISPADLYCLVDSDDISISELLAPQGAGASGADGRGRQAAGLQAMVAVATSSSAKLGAGVCGSRDVARRVSSATSEQQRLHQSLGEASPLLAAAPGADFLVALRPGRQEPYLISSAGSCGSGTSAGYSAAGAGAAGAGVSAPPSGCAGPVGVQRPHG